LKKQGSSKKGAKSQPARYKTKRPGRQVSKFIKEENAGKRVLREPPSGKTESQKNVGQRRGRPHRGGDKVNQSRSGSRPQNEIREGRSKDLEEGKLLRPAGESKEKITGQKRWEITQGGADESRCNNREREAVEGLRKGGEARGR